MKETKCSRRQLKGLAVILVGLAISFLPSPAQAQCNPTTAQSVLQANTPDSRYQALKYLEGCFQVPPGSVTVPVIECDSTGHCGKSPKLFWTTDVRIQGTSARGGHRGKAGTDPADPNEYDVTVGTIAVNAWDVTLSFQRANTNGTWEIDVQPAGAFGHGVTKRAIAAAGKSIASVSIGGAKAVTFSTPELGPVEIHIVRLPIIGVGAFELPVLPLAIVYGMPQDGKSNNTNSYTLSTAISTSLTTSVSNANTTKGPNDVAFVPPMQNLLTTYKTGSDLAKNIPGPLGPVFAGVSQAIPIIQGMLGSMTNEQSQGVTYQTGHSLTLTDSQVDKETSGSTLGPGLDDLFLYLRNVKLMWVAMDGKVQLTILSFKRGRSSGQWLLSHKDTPGTFDCFPDGACLTAEAYKNLLSLDPFTRPLVSVPYVAGQPIQVIPDMLRAPRFDPDSCQDNDFTGSTGNESLSLSHTVTQQDQSQTTTFTQTLTDAKAGWLSFAAPLMSPYVVPTTQTTTSTITNTVSSSVSATTTIMANSSVNAQGNAWGFRSCYDSVYGTFAFVPLQISAVSASYSGQIPSAPGQTSVASRQVVLQSGGRRYVTFTDRQGRYAFHFPIARGSGVLTVGSVRAPVQIR
jgi:hypothetical protein